MINPGLNTPYPLQRSFDELIALIPQERAANMEFIEHAGNTTLVACRAPDSSPKSVSELDSTEYETLLFVSEGYSLRQIAARSGKQARSAGGWLHEARQKLGVTDTGEAASFIPIDIAAVRSLPLGQLSATQRAILSMSGSGVGISEIAKDKSVSESTVRTHRRAIVKTLGTQIQPDDMIRGVGLRRVAGALHTMELHSEIGETVASSGFQSRVDQLLRLAQKAGQTGLLPSLDSKIIKKIDNPGITRKLHEAGYARKSVLKNGELNLSEFIASRLIRDRVMAYIMSSKQTRPIAQAILQNEIKYRLNAPEEDTQDTRQAA